jgi:hypothetical protein
VTFEGLLVAVLFALRWRRAASASARRIIGVPTWGSRRRWTFDHAEVVEVAAGAPGPVLALPEAALLLGLEHGLAGLLFEDREGLLVCDGEKLAGDPGAASSALAISLA